MLGSTNIVAFVPTIDAVKARAFYEGVLGLRFIKDDQSPVRIRERLNERMGIGSVGIQR